MAATVVVAVAVLGSAPAVVAQDMDDSDSGFSDVSEGNFHKADIDALNAQGLLEGTECAEGMFCPGDPMKRWTMAVWLVRALDDAEPAAVEESSFADVDSDNKWLPHVERLAELEVTKGCDTEPLIFCPDDTVTRAEMATFLVRAFNLEDASSAGFTDTAGNFHEPDIDALAAAEVTKGCTTEPLQYCPGDPVSRAQMATFLVRALALSDTAPEETEEETTEEEATEEETTEEETTEEEVAPEPEMTGPKLVANPATVPSAGQHTFTVTGTGFVPNSQLYLLECTIPGAPVSADTPAAQLEAALAQVTQANCNLGTFQIVFVGSDGSFSATKTATVGQNFLWAASDIAQTQSGSVPVFIGS